MKKQEIEYTLLEWFSGMSIDFETMWEESKWLWRIERHVEPIRKRWKIVEVIVYASQTRWKHDGKVYKVSANTTHLNAYFNYNSNTKKNYFQCVWDIKYCKEHRTERYSAYPDMHHTKITFDLHSCWWEIMFE